MRRQFALVTTATLLGAMSAPTVAADDPVGAGEALEVVIAFDAAPEHQPEGVALDQAGNLYVSLGPPFFVGGGYGEVRRIGTDGTETTLVRYPEGPAPAGLAVDASDDVYFAVPNPGQPDAGVYRVTDDGAEQLPGTEQMQVPNGLALDSDGDLYASDSALGEIWLMPGAGTDDARAWVRDDLLAGCEDVPGANGIAFWQGDLYAANTAKGLVARIPIADDGTPGTLEVVAGDPTCEPTDQLFGLDGIAFDEDGQLYALLVLQHQLVRIDVTDGTITPVLEPGDGLWNGASLAFGTTPDQAGSLFIANYAVLEPEPPNAYGPAILRLDVGATAASASMAEDVTQTAPVGWHPMSGIEGAVGDGASATLQRTPDGVTYELTTHSLQPGNAYTAWLVVFNNPAACATSPCESTDLFAADTHAQITFAQDGQVATDDGTASFAGAIAAGPLPDGWFPAEGFDDPHAAEIALVINDHGPVIGELAEEMVSTYRAGCSDESIPEVFPDSAFADGTPGPNSCQLYQLAGFPPG